MSGLREPLPQSIAEALSLESVADSTPLAPFVGEDADPDHLDEAIASHLGSTLEIGRAHV